MKAVVLVAMILTFGVALKAEAGLNEFTSCRCNNGIATKGDYKAEVGQKCGNPVQIQSGHNRDCREMWVYNFGPNEFMQGICFDREDRVKKVISLGHGY